MNELRPTKLADILGQLQVREALDISICSAKHRRDCLEHTLFYGPPGTGKTTLANAIANDMETSIQVANGANLRSIKSIVPYIMRIESHGILFIDEIHRMTKIVEEFLYPIVEDFKVDMSIGADKGDGEVISIDIPKFTLMGATTEFGSLSKPLIDRFKHKYTLKLYNKVDLLKIINSNTQKLELSMTEKAAEKIATMSRGTPRIANSNLEWLRDYQIAKKISTLSEKDIKDAMGLKGIDHEGLTEMDRKYLNILQNSPEPLGIETLCSLSNIDRNTVENIIEPLLLQRSKIAKTPKGRVAI